MYRKNVAGQFVTFQLLLTATGAVATGLSPTFRRCIDGTFAAGGGTITEDSAGFYKCALAQADTNGNDIGFCFTATGAIPVAINIVTTAADPTDTVRFGFTALPNAAASGVGGLLTAPTTANVGLADLSRILGTALTETAGQIAGAFKKVFDVAAPVFTALSVNQTGDSYALANGASGFVATKTDTAAIKTQTDKMTFTVANVIDSNVLRVNGDATAAADLAKAADTIIRGTCSGGTTTTAVVGTLVNPSSLTAAGQLIGRTIIFDGATTTAALQGQASNITNNTTGATPTITFTAMTTAPANTDTFVIV